MNLQAVLIIVGIILVAVVFMFSKPTNISFLNNIKSRLVSLINRNRFRAEDISDSYVAGLKTRNPVGTGNFDDDLPEPIFPEQIDIFDNEDFEQADDTVHGYSFDDIIGDEESVVSLSGFDDSAPADDANQGLTVDNYDREPTEAMAYTYPQIEGFKQISQIDYWAKLYGDRDVGRENIMAQYQQARAEFGNITRLYGVRLSDEQWVDVEKETEDARFKNLVVTMQLVNDGIAVNQSQLMQFAQIIKNISEKTARQATFMTTLENAALQAEELESFVRYFQSLFVVSVIPEDKNYFDGIAIDRCASQLGLEQTKDNMYARHKRVGRNNVCLYNLSNMTDTGNFDFENMHQLKSESVVFFTNPCINRSPGAVFTEMVNTAKSFAARLKGVVVIPGYKDLNQNLIDDVRLHIEEKAAEMNSIGIQSGSDEAIRIF